MDGRGDDPSPEGLYASLDGTGNDVLTTAFPIDDVTVSVDDAGRRGGSVKPSL